MCFVTTMFTLSKFYFKLDFAAVVFSETLQFLGSITKSGN